MLKTLEEFQWSWPRKINRPQIQNLFRLAFIATHTGTGIDAALAPDELIERIGISLDAAANLIRRDHLLQVPLF